MSIDTKLRRFRALLPRLPLFALTLVRYLLALLRRQSIMVVNVPLSGQYPFLRPMVEKARMRREVFLLFAVDDLSGARPRDLLRCEGFADSLIFDYPLAALLPCCDVFLSATGYLSYFPRRSRHAVCSFHGLPTKGDTFPVDSFPPDRPSRFTDLFFMGPTHARIYEAMYLPHHPESRIRVHQVGYPKLDPLFNPGYDTSTFRRRWNIPAGRPVVLYAPAYNEGSSLREYGARVIEELLKLDAVVMVKLHPALFSSAAELKLTGGVDWPAQVEGLKHDNLRHITDPDITPCLSVADLMVGDISGAALEFMMLGKPAIFIDCPRFYEECLPAPGAIDSRQAREDLCFNAGRDKGEVVELARLVEVAARCLAGQGSRPDLKPEDLIYNPGRGAETAWRLLRGFLNLKEGDDKSTG